MLKEAIKRLNGGIIFHQLEPPAEFDFLYDSLATDLNCDPGTLHLFPNNFDAETNTYNANFLVLSGVDFNGNDVTDEIVQSVEEGDNILIENNDGSKFISFVATAAAPLGTDRIRVSILANSLAYNGPIELDLIIMSLLAYKYEQPLDWQQMWSE